MKDKVFVTGHRNPDSDSILAAIGYAYLLNATHCYDAIPVRLGEINRETEFILKTCQLPIPILLKSVKQKVEDMDYDRVTIFSKELTLKTAWTLMKQQHLKSAPVLDDSGHLLGVLSTSNIISGYMDEWDSDILAKTCTPLENIIDTLEASVLYMNEEKRFYTGRIRIIAMYPEEAKKRIAEDDIIIVGSDQKEHIEAYIKKKVGLIILTGSLKLDVRALEEIRKARITVISTPFDTFTTSQQIIQSISIESVIVKDNIVTFNTSDSIDTVKEVMKETRFHGYPVVDDTGRVVGLLSRYQVLRGERKKVIQVDHNERGHSVDGLEEADILEIIDHHRIADIQTNGPVLFRCEPLGSTSTIIAKAFQEQHIPIPKNIAGGLLGAIISDTLLFKSPTCTPTDTKMAKELAKIAELDISTFGLDMFKAGTSLVGKTVEQIFYQDYKRFTFNQEDIGIAQVNTMDLDGFATYKEEMLAFMEEVARNQRLKLVTLLLTDVINSNSEILVAGPCPWYVEMAFNTTLIEHQAHLSGVVSRKKQVVPALAIVIQEDE